MPENKFSSFIFTLSHGGSLRSPLTSPPPEEKSRFAEKKVGFAEKKLRLQKMAGEKCVDYFRHFK